MKTFRRLAGLLRPLRPGPVRLEKHDGMWRVSLTVDGEALWYECSEDVLQPVPEAVACALLMISLQRHRRIDMSDAVDVAFLSNLQELLAVWEVWWGTPRLQPRASLSAVAEGTDYRRKGKAVFFSGGVDSFYSLLLEGEAFSHLIFVHGFDIPIEDEVRFGAFEPALHRIARECGVTPVIVRTNLRSHHLTRGMDWERGHGLALASVAHLLSDQIGVAVIPSSYTYGNFHPWGTSWHTDHLFSSSRVRLQHADASVWRADKLAAIADHRLVQQHLRVCSENRRATGNCGYCEKCVRTMISLELAGRLQDFDAFSFDETLPQLIDMADPIRGHLHSVYRMFLNRDLRPDVSAAISRWLSRSQAPRPG
jgi:hypothetical protein